MSHAEILLKVLHLMRLCLISKVYTPAIFLAFMLLPFTKSVFGQSIELSASAPNIANLVPNLGDLAPPIVDPAGYFKVIVPLRYFSCRLAPKDLNCTGLLPTKATVSIKIKEVPREATVGIIALSQIESVESESHFKKLASQKTTIDGMEAMIQSFTYDNLQNVSLPVWVQVIDILQPKTLAVLQITCFARDCSDYGSAMNEIRQSFHMTRILKSGEPDRRKIRGRKKETQ